MKTSDDWFAEFHQLPDDAVYWEFDGTKIRDFLPPHEPISKEKVRITAGQVRRMANSFINDPEYRRLLQIKREGFALLNRNKPADYDESYEVREEYDLKYHTYSSPLWEYLEKGIGLSEQNSVFTRAAIGGAVMQLTEEGI